MKKTRQALFHSVIALLLCISMLVSSTFAWFTDNVTTGINQIAAGNLDVELEYLDASGNWKPVKNSTEILDKNALWEPGYTDVVYLRVSNAGNLALKYQLGVNIISETGSINKEGQPFKLSDHIEFGVVEDVSTPYADRKDARNAVSNVTKISAGYSKESELYPVGTTGKDSVQYVALVVYMPEDTGNVANYGFGQNPPKIELGIKLVATQQVYEEDAFGSDYDLNAGFTMPDNNISDSASSAVVVDGENKVSSEITLQGNQTSATIPMGVQLESGISELTLTVNSKEESESNITLGENEAMKSLDVHVEGVAADNTVPMIISLGEVMPKGLNDGNAKLYHVENGATVAMTKVNSLAELDAHNEFYYDPATGEVTIALKSFSEIVGVADSVNPWNGTYDYSWFTSGAGTYTIANADQLAAFGKIVGGMPEGEVYAYTDNDGEHWYTFEGETVTLISDINIGDTVADNGIVFYPIGYWNDNGSYDKVSGGSVSSSVYSFEGTFDGNGHTISNFYQNTWEMFGDYNDGYSGTPNHYKDGMGLFGYVHNGTVKNLTIDNFSSDGEFTPTGVIAAYADGDSTFENIAITNCNPRVYNTGNGGIIGIAGDTSATNDDHITLKNITVDNSNKISALWGSWDVACGGLVGMYRGNVDGSGNATGDTISFTNCHVAAQIDVYNDVCANYQYYAYRYAGMIIGSIRHNKTNEDGKTIPDMAGISASGCTVNYGDWNDYYYCEFEKNTIASYSEDYQFSRVPHSELNFTDTNGNGVVDADKRESVTGCKHEHTTNEDKKAVYLPFHQLFTGYSWGVNSIGLEKYSGIVIDEKLDIKEDDQASSVDKFSAKQNIDLSTIQEGDSVDVDILFEALTDLTVDIRDENVMIAVTDLTNTGITADFVRGETWDTGTLKFNGTNGIVKITIQDYYFCNPTSVIVTIGEFNTTERFVKKFNNENFTYRVGNQNEFTIESLIGLKDGVTEAEIGDINVTVVDSNGEELSVYTEESSAWDAGRIDFGESFTGLVTVTITDNNYSTPVELELEVVNATNATIATDATEKNIVLLNNISDGFEVSNGFAVYGNGFKAICSGDGSYSSKSLSYAYITISKGGVMDNVQVVCDVFPESYLFTGEMTANSSGRYPYGYSAVIISGNSTISNCYIYGARNNILVTGGNVRIEDTVTVSGSFANIHINGTDSDTVTLHNVTTVQYETTSNYDTSKKVLGFAVVVGTNESSSNAQIVLTGELKQYNWVTSDNEDVSNTYAQTALKSALKVTDYQHLIDGKTAVNLGIAYLNTKTVSINEDARTNKDVIPYKQSEITMTIQGVNVTGQVYSVYNGGNSSKTVSECYDPVTDGVVSYVSSANREILPEIVYNSESSSITFENAFDSVSQKWINKLTVDLDTINGGSYDFYFNSIRVQKYGQNLAFIIKDASGNIVDANRAITLSSLLSDEYNITTTYDEVEYVLPFILAANRTSLPKPTITYDSTTFTDTSNSRLRLADTKAGDWRPTVNALAGIKITYWSIEQNAEITLDLANLDLSDSNKYNISSNVFTYNGDEFTLTLTGGEIKTGYNITPIVSAAVESSARLYYCSTNVAYGTTPTNDNRTIKIDYVLTVNNETATYNRNETVNFSGLTVVYDYSSFKNGTLKEASDGCVTPDTQITLADGTKKEIRYVTYDDQLLVWDFVNGEYTVMPSIVIRNHGYDNYRVLTLNFSDGTSIDVIAEHGFFDVGRNEFVMISETNVADYIGHSFIRAENEFTTVTLDSYSVTEEYTAAYSILTAVHYNCVLEDMLTLTPNVIGGNYFMPFEVGKDMKYDADKMQEDIEKYGLFTYEEFADYVTEEQFNALNAPQVKVAVGKGIITMEQLYQIIEELIPKV